MVILIWLCLDDWGKMLAKRTCACSARIHMTKVRSKQLDYRATRKAYEKKLGNKENELFIPNPQHRIEKKPVSKSWKLVGKSHLLVGRSHSQSGGTKC